MASFTLAQPMAMATTELERAIHVEDARPWDISASVERSPLRMSWVVVTDSNGACKLQMEWIPSADLR